MKIGLNVGLETSAPLEQQIEAVIEAEQHGLESFWAGQSATFDAMTMLAMAGVRTQNISLGTAVVPLRLPRDPVPLAQQALTVQTASNGRFQLGIGAPQQNFLKAWGAPDATPLAFMREYLTVLQTLLRDKGVEFQGEVFNSRFALRGVSAAPCPVLIGALGPAMLRLAGGQADGTITWLTGPKTVESYIAPGVTKAARDAGRPEPTVCVSLPIALTNATSSAKEAAATYFNQYGNAPHYKRLIEMEGAQSAADLALIGTEVELERKLRELAEAGATEFSAFPFPVGNDNVEAARREIVGFLAGLVGRV